MKFSILLFVAPIFLLASCGETNRDVIEKHKAKYNDLRDELKEIAKAIPAEATSLSADQLSPPPNYHKGGLSNTTIIMFDQLEDPDVDLREEGKFNLGLANNFDTHLSWTGPDSRMRSSFLNETAGRLSDDLRRTLGVKYIAVARVLAYAPPSPLDEHTFLGGVVKLGVHLWDRKKKKIVCSFPADAELEKNSDFKFDEARAMEKLREQARKNVLNALAAKSGGQFE